ncbi:MAG: hypothetical protein OIF50_11360 [Flavobacteriaceae bacterium]|nr:hypothetical protein [Flavobacteriaceae bacterium]
MRDNIERTLFWFSDGDNKLLELDKKFFPLSTLLNRLLCEKYDGKKIQFINLFFRTEETYRLHPQAERFFTHFYDKQLTYDDVFDLELFNKLNENEQIQFLWKRSCEALQKASTVLKNKQLLLASEYAYSKGVEIDLNPDYRVVQKDIMLFNKSLKAAVWINFKNNGMYSNFTLEKDGEIVFQKYIDNTENGVEYFLEIYKDIELVADGIVIKGRKDVGYLPLKVPLEEIQINI